MDEEFTWQSGSGIPVTLVIGPPGCGKTTMIAHCLGRYERRVAVLLEQHGGAGAVDAEILRSMLESALLAEQVSLLVERQELFAQSVMRQRAKGPTVANSSSALLIEMVAGGDINRRVGQLTDWIAHTEGCYLNGVLSVLPGHPSNTPTCAGDNVYLATADAVFIADVRPGPGRSILHAVAEQRRERSHSRKITEHDLHLIFGDLYKTIRTRPETPHTDRSSSVAHPNEPPPVSMSFVQALDPIKVSVLFSCLSHHYGTTLGRAKGVLNLAGSERQLLVQGGGPKFYFQAGRTWQAEELRQSTLCFWGQTLVTERLSNGFRSGQIDRVLH